jgi:hypothetical protein
MAGALLLSRAFADADPALADEILESARTDLHTRTGAARSQAPRQVARRPVAWRRCMRLVLYGARTQHQAVTCTFDRHRARE